MVKQQFSKKRVGFSRPHGHEGLAGSRRGIKNRRKEEDSPRSPTPSDSGELSEEHSNIASEEVPEEDVVIYREPSMYDNLLQKLGSGSESIANANKRRQRAEEGKSDTDEDDDSESLDASEDEEEDVEEEDDGEDEDGSGNESHGSTLKQTARGGSSLEGNIELEHSEDDATDDGDESSEMEEQNLRANGGSSVNASASMRWSNDSTGPREKGAHIAMISQAVGLKVQNSSHSSRWRIRVMGSEKRRRSMPITFNDHLGHKLSKEEVEILLKKRWRYKWEVPALAISSCKWMATREWLQEDGDSNSGYGLKLRLYEHWLDNYKASGGNDFHSSKRRSFFSLCNSYQDILHHNKKPFYLKGREEDSSVMDAYIMHSLNHVFKTRDLVTKNDTKLAKVQGTKNEENLNSDTYLDHGFTRPKVLILLPIASIAFRVVKRLIELTPAANKVNVEHMGRFSEEFGTGVSNDQDDEDIDNSKAQKTSKPSDFQSLFGGNNNDHFMIGIKFTRKAIKLYGDFYSSDMIVASPLGLITKIGEAEVEKEREVDYLSSIEVLIIDHADVIAMQNWSHVNTVVEQLNRIPSKQHGTDIMRIRQWYLDAQAQFYRQTIILGSHVNPEINALFNNHCLNYRGKVKLVCEHKGVLPKVLLQVRQVYERFDAEAIVDADDARLEYFSKNVFPKIKDSLEGGILIFISSYFEFVRVRNFLKSQDASFCLLGEYTKQSDISRARVWFFQGSRKIMLYTERAHFYHRYKIRGIQNLIMYSLPERKEFYPEIVNMLEGSHGMKCTVLFSRLDQLRLERIVGTAPAKRMVTSDKGVFTFC